MQLAAPSVDIGLYTNNLKPMLAFWQGEIGLSLDRVAPMRPGLDQHRHHRPGAFRGGEALFLLEADPSAPDDAPLTARGWRLISFQVADVCREHAAVLAAGGREGRAPFLVGDAARVALDRDPDGNWIEIIQRARPGETFEE